jgi:serine/threonine protein kinase
MEVSGGNRAHWAAIRGVLRIADMAISVVTCAGSAAALLIPGGQPDFVDARADLYGLGAVAYLTLSGRPVFGGSLVEVFAHHLHSGPQPLGEFGMTDAQLNSIVFRCLEKDPNERFASALELSPTPCMPARAPRVGPDRERAHGGTPSEKASSRIESGLCSPRA